MSYILSEPLKKLKTKHFQMFFKIDSIKSFAIFTGKHLCWGLFLIKLQVLPVDIAKFLRIAFLYNTSGGCFWQSYHGTVKSAGMPVLWFHASACFQFWSNVTLQFYTKRYSNNSSCAKSRVYIGIVGCQPRSTSLPLFLKFHSSYFSILTTT